MEEITLKPCKIVHHIDMACTKGMLDAKMVVDESTASACKTAAILVP